MRDSYYFWQRWTMNTVLAELHRLREFYEGRISPAFANLEAEANQKAQEFWDRKMEEPVGEEPDDAAAIAEQAQEEALDWYLETEQLHYDMNGVFCGAIFRLVERFLKRFVARELLPFRHEEQVPRWGLERMRKEYAKAGFCLDAIPWFKKVDTLRLVNNVFKHGEGPSLEELLKREPQFFKIEAEPTAPQMVGHQVRVPDSYVMEAFLAVEQLITHVVERLRTLGEEQDPTA